MSSKILSVQGSKRSRKQTNFDPRLAPSVGANEGNEETTAPKEPHFRGLPNKAIIAVTVALCLFGLMCVFSASAPEALNNTHDATSYLRKQTIACMLGMFAMFTISRYDYRKLRKWAWPTAILSFIALALTSSRFINRSVRLRTLVADWTIPIPAFGSRESGFNSASRFRSFETLLVEERNDHPNRACHGDDRDRRQTA